MTSAAKWEQALDDLRALHAEVDRRAHVLALRHAGRLRCGRGCAACCVDGLRVFEVEAERIRRSHAALLRSQAPRAPGACAFLDAEDSCRIYADRPFVCRTQGLPLRWLEETASGEIVERRDICELNVAGPLLSQLPEDACWQLGPDELELGRLQRELDGGEGRRVALRDLFQDSTT